MYRTHFLLNTTTFPASNAMSPVFLYFFKAIFVPLGFMTCVVRRLANLVLANVQKSFVRQHPARDTSIVLFPRQTVSGQRKEDHI